LQQGRELMKTDDLATPLTIDLRRTRYESLSPEVLRPRLSTGLPLQVSIIELILSVVHLAEDILKPLRKTKAE